MIGRATETEVKSLRDRGLAVMLTLSCDPDDTDDVFGTDTIDVEVLQVVDHGQPSLSISRELEIERNLDDCERDLAVAVAISNMGQLLLKRLLSPEELTTATFDSDSDDSEDYGSEFDPEMN